MNSFITKKATLQQHHRLKLTQVELDTALIAADILILSGGVFLSKRLIDGMGTLQLSIDKAETIIQDTKTSLKETNNSLKETNNSLQETNNSLQEIKKDSDETKNKLSTIVLSLGLFFAILGGSKTLFEAIEFLPTIPDKVKKSVEESDARRSKEIIKELRDQLKLKNK